MATHKLHISDDLSLPVDAATQALGWLGRRGSGKSYGATKLAELFHHAGAQFVAIDPVGIWYGLRLDADGRSPGLDVPIFGGLHGDIALEPTAGSLIADVVVDRGISAVIDVSQFESDADKARFSRDFAARFFYRKKSNPSAVHVFIEECQEFIPQQPEQGEQMMLHAFQRMVRLGRNFGIGVSMISQRPQDVNKKALNQTECLFCFQLTGPQERKAVEGWVSEKGLSDDLSSILPALKVGNAHVWSPVWLDVNREVHIAAKNTFAAGTTPTVGQKSTETRPLAPIELEKLRRDMAATIEKAKENDPKALKVELAKARAEIATLKSAKPAPVESKIVEKAVLKDGQIERIEICAAGIASVVDEMVSRVEGAAARASATLSDVVAPLVAALAEVRQGNRQPLMHVNTRDDRGVKQPIHKNTAAALAHAGRAVAQDFANKDSTLSKCERSILSVLAQYPEGCAKGKLLLLSGYRWSGTYSDSLGHLRTAGLIQGGNSGVMSITAKGAANGPFQELPVGQKLVEYWVANPLFSLCERMILRALIDRPDGLSKDKLLEVTGYRWSGTFSDSLGSLRTAGVIVGKNYEVMKASPELLAAAGH